MPHPGAAPALHRRWQHQCPTGAAPARPAETQRQQTGNGYLQIPSALLAVASKHKQVKRCPTTNHLSIIQTWLIELNWQSWPCITCGHMMVRQLKQECLLPCQHPATTSTAHLFDLGVCLAADEWVQQCDCRLDQHAGLQQDDVLDVLAEGTRQRLVRPHTPDPGQQPELGAIVQRHDDQYVGTLQWQQQESTIQCCGVVGFQLVSMEWSGWRMLHTAAG